MTSAQRTEEAEQSGQLQRPVDPLSPEPWPHYESDEIEAAISVLESGNVSYWTGYECRNFEQEFATYHGVKHGVALANGTLALELAMRVLGIGAGDEVIVTPRSYFASASSIVLAGAKPVFVDVDPDSQNITVDQISEAIGSRTRAILAVHLAGWPCDMPAIMSLAGSHGLKVIEDCAQAHGAAIDGRPVGSFGDVAAFSFCQDKIMSTAGEGGMLITNDADAWSAAWSFKDHGKSWERVSAENHPPGFRWLHTGFGSNYRMTEIQGAIGRIQLSKLDGWVQKRRAHASCLADGLRDLPALRVPMPSDREYHSYYKFYAFVRPERLKTRWTRDRILAALDEEGVPGLSGSCPEIYREEAFEQSDCPTLRVASTLGETSLMFKVHPTLTQESLHRTVSAVQRVVRAASG
jgi:dTDP-4-amino-4,6-dideoxygalactose transaminase